MLAKVMTCAIVGLDGAIVQVEADISPGLPFFAVVGLPDTAVSEARERVRPAIRNSGFTFPYKRVIVNLAPADLKKGGPAYDLPIALAILLNKAVAGVRGLLCPTLQSPWHLPLRQLVPLLVR
jgi:magnesium chelatase family protein